MPGGVPAGYSRRPHMLHGVNAAQAFHTLPLSRGAAVSQALAALSPGTKGSSQGAALSGDSFRRVAITPAPRRRVTALGAKQQSR